MKLDYPILWIEDQPEPVRAQMQEVEDYLKGEGFRPSIRLLSNPDDLAVFMDQPDMESAFDLAIVDRDLGLDHRDGSDIARELRAHLRFTDIIYYSALSPDQLRKQIYERSVDGVYCANRAQLFDVVQGVIDAHLRVFIHANSMRGLSAAVLSECDATIREAIRHLVKSNPEQAPELTKMLQGSIVNATDGRNKKNAKKLAKAQDIDQLLDLQWSSQDLAHALNSLLAAHFATHDAAQKGFKLTTYEDVVRKRNVLVHGRYDDGANEMRLDKRVFSLTPESCRTFRAELLSSLQVLLDTHASTAVQVDQQGKASKGA
jgi:hypothetical protein